MNSTYAIDTLSTTRQKNQRLKDALEQQKLEQENARLRKQLNSDAAEEMQQLIESNNRWRNGQ